MTAEQAAAHLGLSTRRALYQAVCRGQTPVHRFGKRLRFNRADLLGLRERPPHPISVGRAACVAQNPQ